MVGGGQDIPPTPGRREGEVKAHGRGKTEGPPTASHVFHDSSR